MEPVVAMPSVSDGESDPLLARLAALETAQRQLEQDRQVLAAENRVLSLRVQLLESQLLARAVARAAMSGDSEALLLFEDAATPDAADDSTPVDAPSAVAPQSRRTTPAAARRRGRQPLDPALPREVIVLPDPPESQRQGMERGMPMVPGFTQTLEVLARKPAVYYVKRYERTVWVSPAKTAPIATP